MPLRPSLLIMGIISNIPLKSPWFLLDFFELNIKQIAKFKILTFSREFLKKYILIRAFKRVILKCANLNYGEDSFSFLNLEFRTASYFTQTDWKQYVVK